MSPIFRLFLISLLLIGCSHPSAPVDETTMALAEEGDATAQMKVGLAFDKEENYEEAARWYRMAAENRRTPLLPSIACNKRHSKAMRVPRAYFNELTEMTDKNLSCYSAGKVKSTFCTS